MNRRDALKAAAAVALGVVALPALVAQSDAEYMAQNRMFYVSPCEWGDAEWEQIRIVRDGVPL